MTENEKINVTKELLRRYEKAVDFIKLIANTKYMTHLSAREQAQYVLHELGESE